MLDRDYGCGDPSTHLLEGETVLDLGSGGGGGGGGKICFLASHVAAGLRGVRRAAAQRAPRRSATPRRSAIPSRSLSPWPWASAPSTPRRLLAFAQEFKGPWKAVLDDDQHLYERGVPTAVCAKTFDILSGAPYGGQFELLQPAEPVDPAAPVFVCALPATLTTDGPSAPLRRPVAGLTTADCDPTAACC